MILSDSQLSNEIKSLGICEIFDEARFLSVSYFLASIFDICDLDFMPVEPVSSMTNVKLYNEAGEETEEDEEKDNLKLPQGLSSSCKDVVSCGVGNWGFSETELVSSTPFHRYGRASSTADTAPGSTASPVSTTCVAHVATPPATPALFAASRAAVEEAASAPAVTLRCQTRWPRDCNRMPTKTQSYAVLALFFISLSAIVLVSVLLSAFASGATGVGAKSKESSPAVTAGNDGGGGRQDVAENEGGDKGESGDKGGGRDGAPTSIPLPITPSPQQSTPAPRPGQVFVYYQPA